MRLLAVLFFVSYGLASAQNDVQFFETRIRPVLAAQCWSCHSTKAKISFASLQLDKRPDSTIVVSGQPEASRLFQVLQYKGSTKMPPTGMLPAAVIEDFRTWISTGAVWPDEAPVDVAAGGTKRTNPDHWAWKPVSKPTVPTVKNEQWARGEIDRFVLARLEANGLRPVADATAETWLRRVSLDLTGLPPTVAEQDEFLRERNYEKTVDRLLASPGFGQRWGRHWLDQTYYADNIEIGRRVPARHAWRYRDYVIDSINRDVPYPRFILEQLAGDQLPWTKPEERRNNLVATGFLALGPWPLVNADKVQLQMDVVDLQVDMVGRSFLGLTMGCSRCHDHKFDPITLADYYGMAGILASTRTLTGRMGLSVFSNINSVVLPELPEELARRSSETREYWSRLTSAREELAALRAKGKPFDKEIAKANQAVKLLEYLPVVPPTAHAVQDADMPADCRVNIRGNAHQLGKETPRSGVAIGGLEGKLDIADFTSGRKELAEWIGRKENPLTARVMVNRVWHHLFGAGIAPTIDNLGTRGTAPSHPELLDYLATEFMEGGWSLKKLVRRIALSHVYQLGGESSGAALDVDPENRLLWRMSRRRLEAETIRDAMLVVSGTMQASAGGPAIPFEVPGNINLAEPEFLNEEAKLDPATRLRRSVYLPVLRKSQLPELDLLNLFNFPDANQITGPRQATTIPTQSLYLMNAPFVQEQAAALAESLLAMKTTDEGRIRFLARRVYGREIRDGEGERWLAFVRSFNPAEAWKRLCHALLISNEFLYRG